MVLFGLSVASGIVVFGWEKVEKSNIEKNKVQLEVNKKQFGSDIEFLKKFNTKINLTKRLVEGHTAISEVFTIINSLAVDNVRFSELDFQVPNDPRKDKIELKLKGEALSFPALAYQSDVLAETDKLVDASVADLMLGEKGIISFGLYMVRRVYLTRRGLRQSHRHCRRGLWGVQVPPRVWEGMSGVHQARRTAG
jgi:hypothetical protein